MRFSIYWVDFDDKTSTSCVQFLWSKLKSFRDYEDLYQFTITIWPVRG